MDTERTFDGRRDSGKRCRPERRHPHHPLANRTAKPGAWEEAGSGHGALAQLCTQHTDEDHPYQRRSMHSDYSPPRRHRHRLRHCQNLKTVIKPMNLTFSLNFKMKLTVIAFGGFVIKGIGIVNCCSSCCTGHFSRIHGSSDSRGRHVT
jgi:hypothetical protein